jgi:signal transduction histidine kinase
MPLSQGFTSLEHMPTSPGERRVAMGLAVVLVIMTAISPFLPAGAAAAVNGPSFLSGYDLLTALCDCITAFLLVVQFRQTGSVLLLSVGGGYLFTAIMAASHVLTIPGLLLTGNPIGATPKSPLVIRAFWMAGQPIGALTALLVRRFHPEPVRRINQATAGTIASVASLAAFAVVSATLAIDLMPDLTVQTGSWRASYVYFLPSLLAIQATAVVSVSLTFQGRSALTLWLTLTLFSGMIETVIGWLFVGIGLAPARRFSLFFYVARIGGMLSSGLLLLVLLQQIVALYARLIAALQSLKTSEQRLIEQQRMEAVGRLAGGVAHDFNNLLTVIIGNLEMLRMHQPGERQYRMVETATEAAKRGGNLTRQMLTFARRQMLQPAPHDINEVLHQMQDLIGSAAGNLVTLVEDFRAEAPISAIDRNEFELAVLNITVNARDAMPSGGTLTIKTRNVEIPGADNPTGVDADLAPGQYVQVQFYDTGSGMPPEVLSQAFEPFFTTKLAGKGSGLGLSQLHGFARQSGGDATLASAQGHGATVSLYLPRVPTTSLPSREEGDRDQHNLAATILVVEDTADVRDTVAQVLTDHGCRVLRATDAHEGLAMITEHCADLDILLTHIAMPGSMNGLALAELARQKCPRLSALLMTGYIGHM